MLFGRTINSPPRFMQRTVHSFTQLSILMNWLGASSNFLEGFRHEHGTVSRASYHDSLPHIARCKRGRFPASPCAWQSSIENFCRDYAEGYSLTFRVDVACISISAFLALDASNSDFRLCVASHRRT